MAYDDLGKKTFDYGICDTVRTVMSLIDKKVSSYYQNTSNHYSKKSGKIKSIYLNEL